MTGSYLEIIDTLAVPLGTPSAAGATYVNTNNQYDCAVAGLPFFLGPNKEHPYKRETAQYRKQQIDQQKESGEQTLTGWWLRSQSTFHYGAGIRYEEPVEGATVGYRFNKSAGVDVFNLGKVTLLPDVTKLSTTVTNAPKMVGGTDANGINVVILGNIKTILNKYYIDPVTYPRLSPILNSGGVDPIEISLYCNLILIAYIIKLAQFCKNLKGVITTPYPPSRYCLFK